MDGLEVMQGYGRWCMEVCLMRKWRDIWLVGLLSKMLQNNGQDIHMCNSDDDKRWNSFVSPRRGHSNVVHAGSFGYC